jgi:hypothetical protein
VDGDSQIANTNVASNQAVDLLQLKKSLTYDLCVVWNWEYDIDFINLLEKVCKANNLTLLQITPKNSENIHKSLIAGEVSFLTYLDRGTDVDLRFMPFVKWVREHGIFSINPYENASRSCDKALMHPDFIYNGLYTPYTIILPSFIDQPVVSEVDLKLIGESFIIKPAHGSGGEGVVLKATTLSQVLEVRKEHPNDKYLLQANIVPCELNSHPAWFRVLYCGGHVYLNWWNPCTKIYFPVTESEEKEYPLAHLRTITSAISRISGLNLFSTEIAFTADSLYVVIDYVNDPLDLRIQSKAADGVPDKIANSIAENIVEMILKRK